MLGNFTKEEIDRAKQLLEGIKATKFAVNAHKHQCDDLHFHDVRRHLKSELQEFDLAAYGLDRSAQLLVLADISNCVDILVMLILRKESGNDEKRH